MTNEPFRLTRSLALAFAFTCAACGNDPGQPPGNHDMAHPSDGDGGSDGGADGGGSDGGVDGGSPTLSCDELPLTAAQLAQATWDPRFTISGFTRGDGITPYVRDLARGRDGTVIAVGAFNWLGRDKVAPLLERRQGRWQPAQTRGMVPTPPGGFAALAVGPYGDLALATLSGGLPVPGSVAHGEIWLDTFDGVQVIGHFTGGVRRMLWFRGQLWAAGNFILDKGEGGFAGLAVWDGAAWSAPPGGAVNGPVFALSDDNAGDGLGVMVAGEFDHVGGIAAKRVAKWNGTSWQAFDLDYGPRVFAVARGGDGSLYAGGWLQLSEQDQSGGLVRWNGKGWDLVGGGLAIGEFTGVVSDLLVRDNQLYVAGCFDYVNGSVTMPTSVRADSFARWGDSRWQSLDDGTQAVFTAWYEDPRRCGVERDDAPWWATNQRLSSDGVNVYAGGAFPGIGGVASQSIIAHDGQRWLPEGAPAALGISGASSRFAVGGADCALHTIGAISHAGGQPVPSRVLRFRDGWTTLGGALPPRVRCADIAVNRAGDVFLGCATLGQFDQETDPHVLKLDGQKWSRFASLPADLGGLRRIAFDGAGTLWAVGGDDKGYLARWDRDHFTVIEKGFDSFVTEIAFRPHDAPAAWPQVVVGGNFEHIGSGKYTRIAGWNGSAWVALEPGLSLVVVGLAYGAHGIYASTAGDDSAPRVTIGQWDGSAWHEIADAAHGMPAPMERTSAQFGALLARGPYLIANGFGTPVTGGHNAFVYDGTRFTSLSGGINALSADGVALAGDGLWLGGSIAEAGLGDTLLPSVGVAHLRLTTPKP